jgi:predicted enzyme related to lactoylglutathione lyase
VKYFEPSQSSFMLNFRVANLDALLDSLLKEGISVECKIKNYEYGRFGWILDPEGNRMELWEPADVRNSASGGRRRHASKNPKSFRKARR